RANYAALGLLAAGPGYYDDVQAWIRWYFRHLNWPGQDAYQQVGTVYYYKVNPDTCEETLLRHRVPTSSDALFTSTSSLDLTDSTDTTDATTKPWYDAEDSWA